MLVEAFGNIGRQARLADVIHTLDISVPVRLCFAEQTSASLYLQLLVLDRLCGVTLFEHYPLYLPCIFDIDRRTDQAVQMPLYS